MSAADSNVNSFFLEVCAALLHARSTAVHLHHPCSCYLHRFTAEQRHPRKNKPNSSVYPLPSISLCMVVSLSQKAAEVAVLVAALSKIRAVDATAAADDATVSAP